MHSSICHSVKYFRFLWTFEANIFYYMSHCQILVTTYDVIHMERVYTHVRDLIKYSEETNWTFLFIITWNSFAAVGETNH